MLHDVETAPAVRTHYIGVRKIFTATKLHMDQGPLFERLGYRPVERMYAKLLGGE